MAKRKAATEGDAALKRAALQEVELAMHKGMRPDEVKKLMGEPNPHDIMIFTNAFGRYEQWSYPVLLRRVYFLNGQVDSWIIQPAE